MAGRRPDRLGKALDVAAQQQSEREAANTSEPWRKVTVVLKERQTAFLDSLALRVRAATGAHVARAEIIRALVDALEAADLDPSTCTSEADLRDEMCKRILGSPGTH